MGWATRLPLSVFLNSANSSWQKNMDLNHPKTQFDVLNLSFDRNINP